MTERKKLPGWALALDIVGTLFLAAGLFGLFAVDSLPVPGADTLTALAIPLIVLGVLLTIPLIAFIIRNAQSSK